jgi:hypothetical protein
MVAGAVLVVFGFIGFVFRRNRNDEPDLDATEMKAKNSNIE